MQSHQRISSSVKTFSHDLAMAVFCERGCLQRLCVRSDCCLSMLLSNYGAVYLMRSMYEEALGAGTAGLCTLAQKLTAAYD